MNRYIFYKRSFFILFFMFFTCLLLCKLNLDTQKSLNTIPKIKTSESIIKSVPIPNKISNVKHRTQSKIQTDLYTYLLDLDSRESVKEKAIQLNSGHQHNSCVYFVSEALRRVGYQIPIQTCFTGKLDSEYEKKISLTYLLQKEGWNHSNDLSLLLPGDICFTTPTSDGSPTHSYIFMGWVKKGSEDLGYVCDNQSYDYKYTLHVRNIKNSLNDKDAFYYFIYLDN